VPAVDVPLVTVIVVVPVVVSVAPGALGATSAEVEIVFDEVDCPVPGEEAE
jgi:hypothetical protein